MLFSNQVLATLFSYSTKHPQRLDYHLDGAQSSMLGQSLAYLAANFDQVRDNLTMTQVHAARVELRLVTVSLGFYYP